MAIAEKELKLILSNSFPNAYIELKDMVGDEDHYSLTIQDPSFIGLS
ncbi:MAG: BolA family transcriptional regulator, partial [Alphaproteobacteria bacterium]|nr:BolA family transcriptional regulator [Alphaproteobacteria bacterium]